MKKHVKLQQGLHLLFHLLSLSAIAMTVALSFSCADAASGGSGPEIQEEQNRNANTGETVLTVPQEERLAYSVAPIGSILLSDGKTLVSPDFIEKNGTSGLNPIGILFYRGSDSQLSIVGIDAFSNRENTFCWGEIKDESIFSRNLTTATGKGEHRESTSSGQRKYFTSYDNVTIKQKKNQNYRNNILECVDTNNPQSVHFYAAHYNELLQEYTQFNGIWEVPNIYEVLQFFKAEELVLKSWNVIASYYDKCYGKKLEVNPANMLAFKDFILTTETGDLSGNGIDRRGIFGLRKTGNIDNYKELFDKDKRIVARSSPEKYFMPIKYKSSKHIVIGLFRPNTTEYSALAVMHLK